MSRTNNMYGYNDYDGPLNRPQNSTANKSRTAEGEEDNDSDEELNPLRVGQWIEGDSLAPPLGSTIPTIHSILELGNITSNDTIYDLGCGDGRVLLEAYVKYKCKYCIGIEIEQDLVNRFNFLINNTISNENVNNAMTSSKRQIKVIHSDICDILDTLVKQSSTSSSALSSNNNNDDDNETITSNNTDLPTPTVICMYLLPEAIEIIQPKLINLLKHNKNLRILCNTWGIKQLKPIKEHDVWNNNSSTSLFVYTHESL